MIFCSIFVNFTWIQTLHTNVSSCQIRIERYQTHMKTNTILITQIDSIPLVTSCVKRLCVVGVTGKSSVVVEIGLQVCYKGISRKGTSDRCRLGFNKQSWRFGYYQEQFGFIHDKVRIPLTSASRIGVYLDQKAGTLSFYNITKTMTPILRFQTSFTEALYPAFQILHLLGS